jgi:hypothetical protein
MARDPQALSIPLWRQASYGYDAGWRGATLKSEAFNAQLLTPTSS